MNTPSKINLKRGIAVAGIVLALLLANFQPVQGMFLGMHIFISLWRLERTVLQATPAGQYYEGMAWLHIFEVLRILGDHPEHEKDIYALANLTLPNLDALLAGKGATAIITEQQVKAVESEVNWWMSVASPALQADIQKTSKIYPFDQFIGMSMDEAVAYANSRFAELREKPQLVAGTDGKWAFYIYKGVYFEYPSSWYVQVKQEPQGTGNLFLIPSAETGKQWSTGVTTFEAWEILPSSQPFDIHREIDYVDAKWEQAVAVKGLTGYYFIYDPTKTGLLRKFESILYSAERNLKVRVTVLLFSPDGIFFDFDVNEARGKYEYMFHITESLELR